VSAPLDGSRFDLGVPRATVSQAASKMSTPGVAVDPNQSAYDLIKQTLADWGLSSLYDTAISYIQQGFSADEVTLKLEQTDQYKTRFAGNELRKANGLGTLSPAQYIALEDQYRQVLTQYGLPAGFYDQHSDFNNWIGGDVSAAELQSRAQIAKQQFIDAPQQVKDYWSNFGLSEGQAIASILDPSHESLADLQRQAAAVEIGGTGGVYGVNVSKGQALQAADQNVSLDQARQAYQRIQAFGGLDNQIAKRFGGGFSQGDEVNSLLLGDSEASRRRDLAYSEEGAQFSGQGGANLQTGDPGADY